jgi:hypothetical protein
VRRAYILRSEVADLWRKVFAKRSIPPGRSRLSERGAGEGGGVPRGVARVDVERETVDRHSLEDVCGVVRARALPAPRRRERHALHARAEGVRGRRVVVAQVHAPNRHLRTKREGVAMSGRPRRTRGACGAAGSGGFGPRVYR